MAKLAMWLFYYQVVFTRFTKRCLFAAFRKKIINFQEIQKLDGIKNEKLEEYFYEFFNILFLRSFSF
jgi:hypothetical protein